MRARSVLGGAIATLVVATVGVLGYLNSPAHQLHDPFQALQQLDLLYLDQPAPAVAALDLPAGAPALLVVCQRCGTPEVEAAVRVSDDPAVARAYGLLRPDGTVGPGYAVIDSAGRVRYRTFDPGLSEHEQEIAILLDGVR